MSFRFSAAIGLAALGLFAASHLSAGVVLTIDNSAITGAPLDVFTLNGSLVASGVTVSLIPSSPPWSLSSPALTVIGILTPSGLSLPDGGSYIGPIAQVQIPGGTPDGSYSSNPFSISFDDENGRTFYTNSVNLTAEVETPIPEPQGWVLVSAGLLAFVTIRRYRAAFHAGSDTLVR